jgi:hypothetical protein
LHLHQYFVPYKPWNTVPSLLDEPFSVNHQAAPIDFAIDANVNAPAKNTIVLQRSSKCAPSPHPEPIEHDDSTANEYAQGPGDGDLIRVR